MHSQYVSSVCFLDPFNHRHVGEDSLGDLLLAQLKVMIAQLKSDRVHVLGVLDSALFSSRWTMLASGTTFGPTIL